jgi:sulfane dehydrogenase subunit SoxC
LFHGLPFFRAMWMPAPDDPTAIGHDQPPVIDVFPRRTVRHIPLAPHQLTEPITSAGDVFVLSHVGIPRARTEDWWLDIVGLVQKPVRLSFAEIVRMPKREVTALHECAGFPMAPHIATRRFANVVWGGVDLATLLGSVGMQADAKYLWSYGLDRGIFEDVESSVYLKDMPLSRVPKGDALLAYELNGAPLDSEHGFPLRLIVPGFYGTNSVKWLYRLELSDRRPSGPFTTRYYNDPVAPTAENPAGGSKPVWQIAPESVIVSHTPNSTIRREANQIWGWAWADAGIRDVGVSTDGGETWISANVEAAHRWSWQRFTLTWNPRLPGKYALMSRAIDQFGETQPLSNARNCVYEVLVTVA